MDNVSLKLGTKSSFEHIKLIKGKNDLESLYPELAAEWCEDLNDLSSDELLEHDKRSGWWKCSTCGNIWYDSVVNRTYRGCGCNGCPERNTLKYNKGTSFPEKAVFFYVKKYFNGTSNNVLLHGREADVYIPSKKVAIEYDGYFWHKGSANKDESKNKLFKSNGIKLIRVREHGLEKMENLFDCIMLSKNTISEQNSAIRKVLSILGIEDPDVDIKRDSVKIGSLLGYDKTKLPSSPYQVQTKSVGWGALSRYINDRPINKMLSGESDKEVVDSIIASAILQYEKKCIDKKDISKGYRFLSDEATKKFLCGDNIGMEKEVEGIVKRANVHGRIPFKNRNLYTCNTYVDVENRLVEAGNGVDFSTVPLELELSIYGCEYIVNGNEHHFRSDIFPLAENEKFNKEQVTGAFNSWWGTIDTYREFTTLSRKYRVY